MRFLLFWFLLLLLLFFCGINIVFDNNLIQGFNGLASILHQIISRGKLVVIVITGTWMLVEG